jgi:hypothetical protein
LRFVGLSRLSAALIGVGLCVIAFGVLWQFGIWPGSQPSLPPPVALAPVPSPRPSAALAPTQTPVLATSVPTSVPTQPPTPTAVPVPTPAPMPLPLVADAGDRLAQQPEQATGYAVRLAIPSINLDTPVVQAASCRTATATPSGRRCHSSRSTTAISPHCSALMATR